MRIGKAENQGKPGETINVEVDGGTREGEIIQGKAGNEINSTKVLIADGVVFSETSPYQQSSQSNIKRNRPKKKKERLTYPIKIGLLYYLNDLMVINKGGDTKKIDIVELANIPTHPLEGWVSLMGFQAIGKNPKQWVAIAFNYRENTAIILKNQIIVNSYNLAEIPYSNQYLWSYLLSLGNGFLMTQNPLFFLYNLSNNTTINFIDNTDNGNRLHGYLGDYSEGDTSYTLSAINQTNYNYFSPQRIFNLIDEYEKHYNTALIQGNQYPESGRDKSIYQTDGGVGEAISTKTITTTGKLVNWIFDTPYEGNYNYSYTAVETPIHEFSYRTLATGAFAGNLSLTADSTGTETFVDSAIATLPLPLQTLNYSDTTTETATFSFGSTLIPHSERTLDLTDTPEVYNFEGNSTWHYTINSADTYTRNGTRTFYQETPLLITPTELFYRSYSQGFTYRDVLTSTYSKAFQFNGTLPSHYQGLTNYIRYANSLLTYWDRGALEFDHHKGRQFVRTLTGVTHHTVSTNFVFGKDFEEAMADRSGGIITNTDYGQEIYYYKREGNDLIALAVNNSFWGRSSLVVEFEDPPTINSPLSLTFPLSEFIVGASNYDCLYFDWLTNYERGKRKSSPLSFVKAQNIINNLGTTTYPSFTEFWDNIIGTEVTLISYNSTNNGYQPVNKFIGTITDIAYYDTQQSFQKRRTVSSITVEIIQQFREGTFCLLENFLINATHIFSTNNAFCVLRRFLQSNPPPLVPPPGRGLGDGYMRRMNLVNGVFYICPSLNESDRLTKDSKDIYVDRYKIEGNILKRLSPLGKFPVSKINSTMESFDHPFVSYYP